jgi:hypothetical protein
LEKWQVLHTPSANSADRPNSTRSGRLRRGRVSGASPIGVQPGRRAQDQRAIVGNVTNAGVLDPQCSPTPGRMESNGGCDGNDIQVLVDSMLKGPYNACSDMNGDCANTPADIPIFLNGLL